MDFASSLLVGSVEQSGRVISLLSAIISQDAVGTLRSTALMSKFISCCSASAAPEDPPFCKVPDKN